MSAGYLTEVRPDGRCVFAGTDEPFDTDTYVGRFLIAERQWFDDLELDDWESYVRELRRTSVYQGCVLADRGAIIGREIARQIQRALVASRLAKYR